MDEPAPKRPIKPLPIKGKSKGKDKEPLLTMVGYNQTPAELASTFPTKNSLATTTDRDGAWLLDTITALQTLTNRYTKRLDALTQEIERLEGVNSTFEEENQSLNVEVRRLNKVVFELHYKSKSLDAQSASTSAPNPFAFQPLTVHSNAWPSFTSQILQTESSQEIPLLRQKVTEKQIQVDGLQRQLNEACDTLATERLNWDQEKTAMNTQYEQLIQSELSLKVQNSQLQIQVAALLAQCQANESLAHQLQQAYLDTEKLARQENAARNQARNAQGHIEALTREVEALHGQASNNRQSQILVTESRLEVDQGQAQATDKDIELQNSNEEQQESIAKLMTIFADSEKFENFDGDVPATFEDVAGKINELLNLVANIELRNREMNELYWRTLEKIEQEILETGLKNEFLSLDDTSVESAISLLGRKLGSIVEEKAILRRELDNLSSSTSSQSSRIEDLRKHNNEMTKKLESEIMKNADLLENQRNMASNDVKTGLQAPETALVSSGTQTDSHEVEIIYEVPEITDFKTVSTTPGVHMTWSDAKRIILSAKSTCASFTLIFMIMLLLGGAFFSWQVWVVRDGIPQIAPSVESIYEGCSLNSCFMKGLSEQEVYVPIISTNDQQAIQSEDKDSIEHLFNRLASSVPENSVKHKQKTEEEELDDEPQPSSYFGCGEDPWDDVKSFGVMVLFVGILVLLKRLE